MSGAMTVIETAEDGKDFAANKLKDIPISAQLLKDVFIIKPSRSGGPSLSSVGEEAAETAKQGRNTVHRVARQGKQDLAHSGKIVYDGIEQGGRQATGYVFSNLRDDDANGAIAQNIEKKIGAFTLHAPRNTVKTAMKTYRLGRGTVRFGKGTTHFAGRAINSTRRMFTWAKMSKAERKAARIMAHETRTVTSMSVRVASVASRAVSAVVAKIAALAASAVSVPFMVLAVVCVAAIALVTMISSFIPMFHDSASEVSTSSVTGVPAEYREDVERAGSLCSLITAPIIAAQINAESNWNPHATSGVGALGIAQFMPGTWAGVGKDGDGDGRADITNPHDQIYSEGVYMCSLASSVQSDLDSGRVSGDPLQLTIAAYNAGLGSVEQYGTIPPFAETQNYVSKIIESASKYTDMSESDDSDSEGGEAGTLSPRMKLQGDKFRLDLAAMGIPAADTTYQAFQCTWWSAMRRAKIGKPVDGYMGNGGQWDESARAHGYKTGKSPKAGDVIVFEPGVLGADSTYGHVAIVEEVRGNGDILISESARAWMYVAIRNISAASLKANISGITFIH